MKEFLLKKQIRNYDFISFDIFDTLIERDVDRPADIFNMAGATVLGKKKAREFYCRRKEAEENARKKVIHGEANLFEIYKSLEGYSFSEKDRLREAEIKMELAHCHAKESMFEIYQYALSCKKAVYLISDMYLPEDVIHAMLKQCRITGFHKLYISSCYRENKQNGELFQIVLKENGLKKHQLIHIGDSIRADFLGARKAGVQALLIGRKNRLRRLLYK